MKNFFKKIFKRIEKFDNYTSQYIKSTNNIEIPALAYTNWGLHYAEIKDYETAIEKLKIAVVLMKQTIYVYNFCYIYSL